MRGMTVFRLLLPAFKVAMTCFEGGCGLGDLQIGGRVISKLRRRRNV